MKKYERKLLITTEELMNVLSCGRRRATTIGELAHAKVTIGRMVRWDVDILREWLKREAM